MMSKRREVDFSFEWRGPFQGQSERKWGNGGCAQQLQPVSQVPLITRANSLFAARLTDYIELTEWFSACIGIYSMFSFLAITGDFPIFFRICFHWFLWEITLECSFLIIPCLFCLFVCFNRDYVSLSKLISKCSFLSSLWRRFQKVDTTFSSSEWENGAVRTSTPAVSPCETFLVNQLFEVTVCTHQIHEF